MASFEFSPNLVSGIDFTFKEIFTLGNALTNAIIHTEEYLQKDNLSPEQTEVLNTHLEEFKCLDLRLNNELADYGIERTSDTKFD